MDPRGDPDLEARVAAHRARRDPTWQTIEAGDQLAEMLASLSGTVLVDSLGPWVASAGMGLGSGLGSGLGTGLGTTGIDVGALCDSLQARTGDTVVVSDEVGIGRAPVVERGAHIPGRIGHGEPGRLRDRRRRLSRRRRTCAGTPSARGCPRGPDLRRALSFLTVLGGPPLRTTHALVVPARRCRVGASSVPLVGGRPLWPVAVAAVVAVAVDAAVTGCLHLDGLADAADGLIPPVSRSRRFEIMADPRVGAFGCAGARPRPRPPVGALSATPRDVGGHRACGAGRAR